MKKFIVCSVTTLIILGLFIFGNYEINKNKQLLEKTEKTIFVKIISPNFDLKYGLNKKEIEDRMKNLIRYSDPEKDRQTLFVWPEGVFSGYSFDVILTLKILYQTIFSKNTS